MEAVDALNLHRHSVLDECLQTSSMRADGTHRRRIALDDASTAQQQPAKGRTAKPRNRGITAGKVLAGAEQSGPDGATSNTQ